MMVHANLKKTLKDALCSSSNSLKILWKAVPETAEHIIGDNSGQVHKIDDDEDDCCDNIIRCYLMMTHNTISRVGSSHKNQA